MRRSLMMTTRHPLVAKESKEVVMTCSMRCERPVLASAQRVPRHRARRIHSRLRAACSLRTMMRKRKMSARMKKRTKKARRVLTLRTMKRTRAATTISDTYRCFKPKCYFLNM